MLVGFASGLGAGQREKSAGGGARRRAGETSPSLSGSRLYSSIQVPFFDLVQLMNCDAHLSEAEVAKSWGGSRSSLADQTSDGTARLNVRRPLKSRLSASYSAVSYTALPQLCSQPTVKRDNSFPVPRHPLKVGIRGGRRAFRPSSPSLASRSSPLPRTTTLPFQAMSDSKTSHLPPPTRSGTATPSSSSTAEPTAPGWKGKMKS